tara:strand:+ start:4127 stop:4594 length:468 start_codon:yes stop_codon:yes gene_type:complete
MNIFLLDWDIPTCARYHCDKHVVKMILESTQMLSSVHTRYESELAPYRPVHQKHPCTLWAGETKDNYLHLLGLAKELCKEYTFRYGKIHKCQDVLKQIDNPPANLNKCGSTDPAQAMPDQYKNKDPIKAYRDYYLHEKQRFAVWKNRPIPTFMMT